MELPLTSIIGGLCTFGVWLVVVYTHAYGRIVGFAWLGSGLLLYVAYRRSQKLSLTKTVKVEIPTLQFPEVEYNNILVPVVGTKISREAAVMACELASEEDAAIQALSVIEVPLNRPLEPLPEEVETGQQLIDETAQIAEEYGVRVFPRIVPGRQAGRTIVEEAAASKSQVVMIGAERKRRVGERFFGSTVEYVLKNAPCKVLVVAEEKEPGIPDTQDTETK